MISVRGQLFPPPLPSTPSSPPSTAPSPLRSSPPLVSSLFPSLSNSPDHVSYGILIKSHCLLRHAASYALLLLADLRSMSLPVTPVILTTILDSLYKEGKPGQAEQIWQELKSASAVDLPAYTVRLMYFSLAGRIKEVQALIREMEAAGVKPDIINGATYNNIVHLLCKNGDFAAAAEVSMDGMKRGKVLDFGTTKMLVEGLLRGRKARAAKRVVSKMRHEFPGKFEGRWKALGKEVGLKVEEGASMQAVAA